MSCTPLPKCPNCFAYSSGKFKDTFLALDSIDEKIDYLMTVKHDFYRESEPEEILSWFYKDVLTPEHAERVAKAFMARLGDTIICREASCCMNRLMTLMDVIGDDCETRGELGFELILMTFRAFGFKRSNETDWKTLYRMYCDYYDYTKQIKNTKPLDTDSEDDYEEDDDDSVWDIEDDDSAWGRVLKRVREEEAVSNLDGDKKSVWGRVLKRVRDEEAVCERALKRFKDEGAVCERVLKRTRDEEGGWDRVSKLKF